MKKRLDGFSCRVYVCPGCPHQNTVIPKAKSPRSSLGRGSFDKVAHTHSAAFLLCCNKAKNAGCGKECRVQCRDPLKASLLIRR